jgi:hypothetical protein
MNGIILLKSNYSYKVGILDNLPHGHGIFKFANNDRYEGDVKYSKPDGFGIYYFKNGATYTGFVSYGKRHGIGTFEDTTNIYKGTWRNDYKHGIFIRTHKINFVTYKQQWSCGKLITSVKIQYIAPECMSTQKLNPFKKGKQRKPFRGIERKCMGCYEKPIDCTNDICGHVAMCYECLSKCDKCPICRAPIQNKIRLFIG